MCSRLACLAESFTSAPGRDQDLVIWTCVPLSGSRVDPLGFVWPSFGAGARVVALRVVAGGQRCKWQSGWHPRVQMLPVGGSSALSVASELQAAAFKLKEPGELARPRFRLPVAR